MTRIALLMGNRLNAWHTAPFARMGEHGIEIQAFTYRPFRYPLEEVSIPYEILPIRSELRSVPRRVSESVRARVLGEPVPEDPVGLEDRLEGSDLIHSWELFSVDTQAALDARARWGTPVVVTVWDNIPFHREEDPVIGLRKQRARAEADRFLVYSDLSRAMLITEGVSSDRITLILPAVDTDRFHPGNVDRDVPVILAVGRLTEEKGIEDLMQALALIGRRNPELPFQCRVIGSGPIEDRIDRLADSGGFGDRYRRTANAGYAEMPEHYRSADVLVCPSRPTSEWKEQFGMALLEGMASGLAVVGARSGAIPEIVGDSEHLFDPGNFAQLAEKLEILLADSSRRRSDGIRARERAVTHFATTSFTSDLANLYNRFFPT